MGANDLCLMKVNFNVKFKNNCQIVSANLDFHCIFTDR